MDTSKPSMRSQVFKPTLSAPVRIVFCLLLALVSISGGLSADQTFDIDSEDMVAIKADQAWEDVEPDTIHFSGNFEMRIRDLILMANQASLFGRLENPDRFVLQGSPANFTLTREQSDRTELIEAEAQEIIYERDTDLVFLNGDARLSLGEHVLQSAVIEYNIETDRFRTRAQTGVEINVESEN
jgi:lipopolysaccharide transport protein LptA